MYVKKFILFIPPGKGILLPWARVCVYFMPNTLLLITRLLFLFYFCFYIAFPEDDRLEYDLHAEEKRHDQIQATLNSESRAAESLARAVRHMDACQGSMQEALGYSRYGPFSFIYFAPPPSLLLPPTLFIDFRD